MGTLDVLPFPRPLSIRPAINLPVNDEETEDVLKSLVGNAVQLATDKGRLWHREHWNFLILAWNPIIILTTFSNVTKDHLCDYFSNNGHVVLPSGEGASHIIRGSNKPVPTTTFMAALIDADVDFVRLINFGMKKKLHTFPHLPRELLSCNTTDHGYPLMNGTFIFQGAQNTCTLSNLDHHTQLELQ